MPLSMPIPFRNPTNSRHTIRNALNVSGAVESIGNPVEQPNERSSHNRRQYGKSENNGGQNLACACHVG